MQQQGKLMSAENVCQSEMVKDITQLRDGI
jgi:hypothetical protein